ncbi:hypothetical protein [Frigoribacterium sp. PvP032]|uniref:hypothetical protein n=1 Tax=Frigoribacterium sp. PvP032 TaxID=2806589 RepID=UPI001AE7BC31|nr:hypothetical protein [Frigoribacterium sp. PvP032]MBP1189660.1 hypothetical protein [Frigoribacterium sp. PvP032]
MDDTTDPFRCELLFAATHGDGSRETAALRRRVRRGQLVRIHQGTYAAADGLRRLDARGRHVVLVRAVTLGLADVCVVSHASAAVLHDLPRVGPTIPDVVTVVDPRRSTTSRSTHLFRRPGQVTASETAVVSGLSATDFSRTAVDVARTSPFADAVLCVDAVLRRLVLPSGHETGPDVVDRLTMHRAELFRLIGSGSRPGDRAARRVVQFASPWAENGGESLLRLLLFELGLSDVHLQRSFESRGRFAGRCDAFLAKYDVALEFNGLIKLIDPTMLARRTPAEAVRDRGRRDRRLLESDEIEHVVHCEYLDVVQPRRLAGLLQGVGVALDPRRVDAAARIALRRFVG